MPGFIASSQDRGVGISKALNCTGEKSKQLLACFQEAAVEDLVMALNTSSVSMNSIGTPDISQCIIPTRQK